MLFSKSGANCSDTSFADSRAHRDSSQSGRTAEKHDGIAAADERDLTIRPEIQEPSVQFMPMTDGWEVVEAYLSKGLTLRRHPIAIFREKLTESRIISCSELQHVRDGQRVTVAGLVLVRQKPGTGKGVTLMTIEDETDVANVIIWSSIFEKQRRVLLSSGMGGCRGRVQREGQVISPDRRALYRFFDLRCSVSDRDDPTRTHYRQGNEVDGTILVQPGGHRENGGIKDLDRVPVMTIRTRDFR